MGAEVLALEETLVQGLQDKSALDEKLARFLTENENLKKELEDFESLMEDMKAVAQESEDKDALIAELRLEDEKKEEAFFALEAQLFKVEQDALDSLDAFETLKADFNLVAEQLEVYREKEQVCFYTTIGKDVEFICSNV